eukprot:CAMPEP_0170556954 /NCGR_PEP_ID=MMETSP0211-20121228/19084_1 /TAXON_ID=311385 /ORGANISM="Pseudokeronopsis sp., Strain OXSARD2" /LENGTH=238 /DNA_ID=CAMNT_0010867591 /DNA_START=24 /DNA_END=740 /DNA_ORIENTATION=-
MNVDESEICEGDHELASRVVFDHPILDIAYKVCVAESEVGLQVCVGVCLGGGQVVEGASLSICHDLHRICNTFSIIDDDLGGDVGVVDSGVLGHNVFVPGSFSFGNVLPRYFRILNGLFIGVGKSDEEELEEDHFNVDFLGEGLSEGSGHVLHDDLLVREERARIIVGGGSAQGIDGYSQEDVFDFIGVVHVDLVDVVGFGPVLESHLHPQTQAVLGPALDRRQDGVRRLRKLHCGHV